MSKDISVHVHSKTNTVAISMNSPLLTNKLLSTRNIPLDPEEEQAEMTPYKVLGSNQCQGLIYLQGKC